MKTHIRIMRADEYGLAVSIGQHVVKNDGGESYDTSEHGTDVMLFVEPILDNKSATGFKTGGEFYDRFRVNVSISSTQRNIEEAQNSLRLYSDVTKLAEVVRTLIDQHDFPIERVGEMLKRYQGAILEVDLVDRMFADGVIDG